MKFFVGRFFEWHREKGQRQPYFIYFTDNAPSEEMRELSAGSEGRGSEDGKEGGKEGGEEGRGNVWEHPTGRMLTMAGLFDIWKSQESVSCIYGLWAQLRVFTSVSAGRTTFLVHCDNS